MATSGINVSMLNDEIEVDMSDNIVEYFQKFHKQLEMLKQKEKKWVQEVNYKVKKQLKKGTLSISKDQRELAFN